MPFFCKILGGTRVIDDRILMRQCGQIVDLRPTEDRPNELLLRQLRGEEEPEVERPERHCYIYAWCLLGNHVHLLNFLTLLRTYTRIKQAAARKGSERLFMEQLAGIPWNEHQTILLDSSRI